MLKHLILNLTVILETFSYMIKAYSWRNINQQAKEPDISNKRKKNGRIRSVPSLGGLPFLQNIRLFFDDGRLPSLWQIDLLYFHNRSTSTSIWLHSEDLM